MRSLARVGVAVLALVLIAYGGYRLERRSRPPEPAIVLRTADVAALLEPPFAQRVRHAILGSAADQRVAGPKLIALTFDDGPYPVDTPVLLAALRSERVPGTFFLIGRDAEQYPGLVRAIAAGGNEIADHTETHPNLAALDASAVTREVTTGAATLAQYVSDPAIRTFFRPPHGRYTAATLAAVQRAGYDTILWTDDPGDWRDVDAATLRDHIARYATSPEILLLHNGRPATVAALPGIVDAFRRAGYRFLTVGALLQAVGPGQLNHAARTPLSPAAALPMRNPLLRRTVIGKYGFSQDAL